MQTLNDYRSNACDAISFSPCLKSPFFVLSQRHLGDFQHNHMHVTLEVSLSVFAEPYTQVSAPWLLASMFNLGKLTNVLEEIVASHIILSIPQYHWDSFCADKLKVFLEGFNDSLLQGTTPSFREVFYNNLDPFSKPSGQNTTG